MITDSYDPNSLPVIAPGMFYQKAKKEIHTAVLTFSGPFLNTLVKKGELKKIELEKYPGNTNGPTYMYLMQGTNIGMYLCPVGGVMASSLMEEFHYVFGLRNFIVFGSCGTLIDTEENTAVIPTEAYRDEGTSYHYVKPSDYIVMNHADQLEKMFLKRNMPYVKGRVWTTDAYYRETENNRRKRVTDGCIAVDMECAAMQAVADYLDVNLYHFLYTADALSENHWQSRSLETKAEYENRENLFAFVKSIALEIGGSEQ